MITVVITWTVAFFLTNMLQCFPIAVNWTGWGAAVNSCINTNVMFLAQAWSDMITDGNPLPINHGKRVSDMLTVMILSLPLPCVRSFVPRSKLIANTLQIWQLCMPTSQKIGVSSIFLLGTL